MKRLLFLFLVFVSSAAAQGVRLKSLALFLILVIPFPCVWIFGSPALVSFSRSPAPFFFGKGHWMSLVLIRLFRRSPSAILRHVVSIVIGVAIKICSFWFFSHICKKISKRVFPSLANSNSSTSISVPTPRMSINAATFHVLPSHVGSSSSESNGSMSVTQSAIIMIAKKFQWLTKYMTARWSVALRKFCFLSTSTMAITKRYFSHGAIVRYTLYGVTLFLFAIPAFGQGVRFSSTVTQQGTVGASTNVVVLPAAPVVKFCLHPANSVPCSNLAATYTDQTLAIPCLTSTQIVRDGTNTCVASPDAQNNWGVWVAPNTAGYDYTITLAGGVNLGPFNVLSQTTTHSQPETFTGAVTTASLNGDFVTGGTTYPLTGAGLQSAITAASGLGCVYAVRGTYTLLATLTIPSNTCVYWDNATIASNGYNGDLISSTSTSNITFRGKLILNGAGSGTGATSQGINFTTVTNFSFEDIESSGTKNSVMQLSGDAHVRGNKIYVTGCNTAAGGTSTCVFGANSGTTPLTDVQIDEIEVTGMSGTSDCVYFSGTTATPSQRINIGKLDLQGCTDSAVELNFLSQANLGQIVTGPNIPNEGVLLRRGVTDINVNSVSCGSGLKVCVDVANFQTGDPTINRVTVGQVTATGENTDLTNGAAVRVSNSLTTSSVLNVSFGKIVADTSTRGFYCTGTSTTPSSHITVDSIVTHNNKGDGILLGNSGGPGCNDVVINSVISYDNNQGGTTDEGVGIKTFGANGVVIGSGRLFDDQGAGKTQKYGVSVDSTSASISSGILDCQDTLEVTQCLHDASSNAAIIYRRTTTPRLTFGQQGTSNSTLEVNGGENVAGLNDFGSPTNGKIFLGGNGTVCTNGELALSAGWGTTAAPSNVAGTGQTCHWTITSSGTGQAANPTITDTLTNGVFAATVCDMRMEGGTGANTLINQSTLSGSAPVFTFNGTPVAASTYIVVRRCGP